MRKNPLPALAFFALAAPAALAGQQMQGQQMQGQQMQGTSLSGSATPPVASDVPLLHSYSGWIIGNRFASVSITQGRLEAPLRNGRVLSGADLVGAYAPAEISGTRVWTQIRSVQADSTFPQGDTLLYSIDILNSDGSTRPLCTPDLNGVSAAIPVAAVFDQTGARVESATQFIFGCTSGVIAKCYRWGYRPWLSGAAPSQEFAQLHLACTRMARADYCGNGQSWTRNGTLINIWDRAPSPGPFQDIGSPTPDFLFEAGWSPHGAVCMSKQRWATLPPSFAAVCPDRLIAPGATTSAGTVCNTEAEALQFDTTTQLFNESKLNVQP